MPAMLLGPAIRCNAGERPKRERPKVEGPCARDVPARAWSQWSAAMYRRDLQIDAGASAFAALHPPAGKSTSAQRAWRRLACGRSNPARRGCRSRRSAGALRAVAVAAAAGRHPRGHCGGCRGGRGGRSRSCLRLRLAGCCLLLRGSRLLLLGGRYHLFNLLRLLSLRFRLLRLLCHVRPPDRCGQWSNPHAGTGVNVPCNAGGTRPPVAQSISSTVWTIGITVPVAICLMHPTLPAAITSGSIFSIFPTLRARNIFAMSGCRML